MIPSKKIVLSTLIFLLFYCGFAEANQPLMIAQRRGLPARPAPQTQAAPAIAVQPAPAADAVDTAFGARVQPVKGIDVRKMHFSYGRYAAITVSDVVAGSSAETMGLRPGDVILSVNYTDVYKPQEFADAVSALNPGDKIVLLVARQGQNAQFMETVMGGTSPSAGPENTLAAVRSPQASAEIHATTGQHRIYSIALSQDGQKILTGGDTEDSLNLWDMTTGSEVDAFTGYTETSIAAVAFSPDGRYALSGGKDTTVRLWDVSTGKEIRTFTGHAGMVLSVAFSPDGRYAVSGSRDNTLKLWDVATGEALVTFSGHTDGVDALAFSPDGRRLLSGSRDNTLKLWDVTTGRPLKTFTGHQSQVYSVLLLPDGRQALSRDNSRVVKRWDLESGRAVQTFSVDNVKADLSPAASKGVRADAFSPDGRYLLTTSLFGGMITLWDVAAGKAIRTFSGHTGVVAAVAFASDGKRFVSGGYDGTVWLWDLESGKESAQFIGLKDREWIALTSEGYYNSSPSGHQYINIRMGRKVYGIDQFYDVFYRPDIVAAKLRGEDISSLVTLTLEEAIRNPPPFVEFTSVPSTTDQPKVNICFDVQSTGGGIGEVRLFHNGKLIDSDGYYKEMAKTSEKMQLAAMTSDNIYEDMRSIKITAAERIGPIESATKGATFENCKTVDAIPGENEISLAAFNSGNSVQSIMKTVKFNANIPAGEPSLYILSVGIDRYADNTVDLKYASKDAQDIAAKLFSESATIYKPENIHSEVLADENATKANILGRIDEISQKMKPTDSFILFVAGHGVLLQNQYYILTHDYSGTADTGSLISSNEIVEMSKKIKSLSQLFIFDTCHAGGVDYIVSGLYDARMSVLAKKMGLHIYASANDKQAALDGYQGNGLFTHVLLEGLNNNKGADLNKNGMVTMVGLGEYTQRVTTDLSRQIGHTQTPFIINFGKDSPIYELR